MEIQVPLILFTTLLAWSAGLFATQCVYALRGIDAKAQMPAWIASAVLLVVGGVAVFMHLQHWERIFNGFGHITSGITQEFIAIVVLAVVALVYLVFLRKGDGRVPAWIAWVGIVVSAVLVVVMSHSYMMPSRPAWNSVFQILSIVGAACVMGPASMAAISGFFGEGDAACAFGGLLTTVGSLINTATSIVYIAVMAFAVSSYASLGYYFDPTHPTFGMASAASLSPFDGGLAATVISLLAALAAVACAFVGKKNSSWKVWGIATAVCGCVSAIALRVLFYQMGGSVFLFY